MIKIARSRSNIPRFIFKDLPFIGKFKMYYIKLLFRRKFSFSLDIRINNLRLTDTFVTLFP